MAVTSNTPAAPAVATEYNYLDSLSLAEGLHKPQVDPALVMRYGRQDVTGLMEMLGRKNPINQIKFSHYEQDRIHSTVRLSASAATASGSGVTLAGTAAAAYTYSYTGQSPYATSDGFTANVLRQYDVIEVNGFTMLVTAVNGNTFSAISYDSSATRPAIATTDDIIIKGSAQPEGSSAPASRNSRLLSYTNYMQIHRSTHKITGTEQGVQTWVEVEGKDGQKDYFWYLEGIADEYHRHLNEMEALLLTGEDFQNNLAGLGGIGTASIGDANSITATRGLIPQISADGNTEAYTSGALVTTDIENMVKNLQKYRGSKENMIFCGHNMKLDIDRWVRTDSGEGALTNGGIQFAAFQGVNNREIRYEIDSFSYGGFKFATKVLDIFSDPNFLGYAGGIYNELGIVVPLDNTVTYNSMSTSSGVNVPSMRINYMSSPEGDRDMVEWVELSKFSGNDFWRIHWLSHFGLEAFALNRFVLLVG